MPSRKEYQEQRAPIGVEIRTLAGVIQNENRDFTPAERSHWDAINSDFDALTREIDRAARPEGIERRDDYRPHRRDAAPADRAADIGRELESRQKNPPGTEDRTGGQSRPREERDEVREEARALALQAWCRHQSGLPLTDSHRRACKRAGLSPTARAVDIVLPRRPGGDEKRSLSATVGASGGYTVPTGFVANLEKALKDFNGVRAVADVMRTDGGGELFWPTVNDTANKGRRLGENQPVAQTDPPFGMVAFHAYKYTSDLVLIPFELLEDSAFALAVELAVLLGERLARAQEEDFTVGTGNGMPLGVVAGSSLGATAGSGSAISGDDILNLIHSVDPSYRRDPSFAVMMHDLIFAAVRKVKDSQGRYLFEEGQNGMPPKVKGVPVVINQNMASAIATGNKTMVAGPFKKYKVRDVNRVRFRRLDERYAENDQVGFVAFLRSDGRLLNAGTGPIRHLIHP